MSRKEKLIKKMLARPPEITFSEFEVFMELYGWVKDRQKGSHVVFSNGSQILTVPIKKGKKVKRIYIIKALECIDLESK